MIHMKYCLLLYSFICSFGAYAQTTDFAFTRSFTYKLVCQEDSTNSLGKKEIFFNLFTNEKESLFQSIKALRSDSIDYVNRAETSKTFSESGLAVNTVFKFNFKIVKFEDDIIVYDEPIGRNVDGSILLYQYRESKSAFSNWVLTADTLRIGPYLCQKATINFGGRNWVAYFTPEIALSDGPYKFSGLPGLILKVHDEHNFWSFELIEIKNLLLEKPITINFQARYQVAKSSKEEMYKARKRYQGNFLMHLKSAGYKVDENIEKVYNEKLKADNNWIELLE